MKNLGLVLLFIGALFMYKAYNTDTTVTTESRLVGSGTTTIYVPAMSVNNIGKMEERRNNIIVAGVILLASVILYAAGSLKEGQAVIGSIKMNPAKELDTFEKKHKAKIIAAIVFFWGLILWCGWYMLTTT